LIVKVNATALAKRGGDASVLSTDYVRSALGLPPEVHITNNQFVDQCGVCAAGQLSAQSHLIVQLNGALSVNEALARLENHPLLAYAEPDYIGTGGATVPNDPNYGDQWGHGNIQSPNAWDITTGTSAVIVAVLDTGVNTTLTEFSGRTVAGYDYANGDADPSDDNGHGTAVASVIGANTDNGYQMAGMDWNCRIMPVKVLNSENWGYLSWWTDGVDFAVSNGAKVINLSAGASNITYAPLTSAITNAVAQGVIFVTITHNDSSPHVTFPGTLPETITVGATHPNDDRATFSNWGPEIDLVAPGTNIVAIYHTGAVYTWWGTSFAAPHVAGVAALLASVRPDIDNEEVRTLLCAGAEDQVGNANDTPGFDNYYGWGRLNAWHTLQLATTPAEINRMYDTAIMTWGTPANASTKQPYKVETTADLSSPWVSLPASNITYSPSQAQFVIDPLDGKSFYRPRVALP